MAEKGVLPENKELYSATRIMDGATAFGFAVLPVDEKKAFLVDRMEENQAVDGAPCMCWYQAVYPESVRKLEADTAVTDEKQSDTASRKLRTSVYTDLHKIVSGIMDGDLQGLANLYEEKQGREFEIDAKMRAGEANRETIFDLGIDLAQYQILREIAYELDQRKWRKAVHDQPDEFRDAVVKLLAEQDNVMLASSVRKELKMEYAEFEKELEKFERSAGRMLVAVDYGNATTMQLTKQGRAYAKAYLIQNNL